MLKNILIVGVLAVLMSVGLAGVAVAGEGDYRDIVGTDEFVFSSHGTEADSVAKAYVYDQEALANVGSEAGNWQYDFMSSGNKASDNVAGKADRINTKCQEC